MIDNSIHIAAFCPATDDGDTFIYTEMLDRSKRKGNNGQRLLKTFYHRSVAEFWEQWPTIKKLCDLAGVRACTRVSPRSYRKVGATFTKLVVEAALTDNWLGMKSLYNRACGITAPERKLWLWDFDAVDEVDPNYSALVLASQTLARLIGTHAVNGIPVQIAEIPSKRAFHLITTGFDTRALGGLEVPKDGYALPNVQLHKDNPTNLYIPDEAA
jgi:hypothetical protein